MSRLSYADLCPGYLPEHYAPQGRCCCGLHWVGKMPLHDRHGRVLDDTVITRLDERAHEADAAAERRRKTGPLNGRNW